MRSNILDIIKVFRHRMLFYQFCYLILDINLTSADKVFLN